MTQPKYSVTVAKSAFEWQMFSRCSFSPTAPCIGIDSAKRKKGRDMGQGLTKHEASTPHALSAEPENARTGTSARKTTQKHLQINGGGCSAHGTHCGYTMVHFAARNSQASES